MKREIRVLVAASLTASLWLADGCSARQPLFQSRDSSQPAPKKTLKPGALIIANPNPIRICSGEQAGVTTLSWTADKATSLEVHVNSPGGPLFSRSGPAGRNTTGKWVQDKTVFYLQDISQGQPLTPLSTLASVTVRLERQVCPEGTNTIDAHATAKDVARAR